CRPRGSPIEVRARPAGDLAALDVQARGTALSPEDLAHLFAPFFRSAEARRRGYAGVGLGLAVARRIAAAFGGTIEVRSEPGRGSTFTLLLPLVPEPSAGAGCQPAPAPMPGRRDCSLRRP